MRAGTHLIAGALAMVWTASDVEPFALLPLAGGVCLGALLPDLDHRHSAISRSPLFALGGLVRLFVGHRGFLHSLAGWLALTAGLTVAVSGLGPWSDGLLAGVVLGYGSHLVLDALTPLGIQLLWPLRWRLALPLVRTGSMGEAVFAVVMIVGVVKSVVG